MSTNERSLEMARDSKIEIEGGKEMEMAGHVMVHHGTNWSKVKSFVGHLLQMVLAMEAGMVIYHTILRSFFVPTYNTLTHTYPVLGYSLMVVAMVIPMVALMRFYHKSAWRYCLEMSGAMVVPIVPLVIMVQVGLLPSSLIQGCGVGDPLMILAMAGFMLLRPAHNHGTHGGSKSNCH